MAHFQSQYDNAPGRQTDEYGNQVQRTDEYGNPIHQTGAAGTFGTGTGLSSGAGGNQYTQQDKDRHGSGMLHRSGSSGSSSSEDDGQGGRRKKGIKEKIKEKVPGLHKDDQAHVTPTSMAAGGYGTYGQEGLGQGQGQQQEKKGMMEKIKEKLPGHH